MILFPEIHGDKKHSPQGISKAEAMPRILPPRMVAINRETAGRYIELTYDLVDSCDCYESRFGPDVDLPGKLVETVLSCGHQGNRRCFCHC